MSEENNSGGKDVLVVASKTKAYIKSQGCIVSGDAVDALNDKIYEMLDAAIKRTKENKRTTLRSYDF